MKRLYLHVYLTIVASLVLVVAVAAGVWEIVDDDPPTGQFALVASEFVGIALGPAESAPAAQQAVVTRLAERLAIDLTLYDDARNRIAHAGKPLPPPRVGKTASGWQRDLIEPVWALRLSDGRWLMARPLRRERASKFGGVVAVLGGIAFAVALAAFPLARRITRRIERLQAGVESLGAGDLTARIAVKGRDEVSKLAASFNRAAARIEELVKAHKLLLANASHELRTPLTRLRMGIELAAAPIAPARKAALDADIAELDRLIDEILLASRLDAVAGLDVEETVDLLALAAEECARYPGCALDGAPAAVRGDPALLRRLLRNLIENAQRHGVPPVEVRIDRRDSEVEIAVADHGPGVPAADRERVFEPFFRTAASGVAGAGLGLALVRQIATRHGGAARCAPTPERASRFVATLPVLPAPAR
ncbi:MAG: HAMP domain-containing histidine kinase [Alphaproteobacteria bacterium]|nr:HAMP domain-containing histidine kinase [Alphaproteobacteria bacterium]